MFKLSTKGEYGLRAIVDLAVHYGDEPIHLKDIAQRQDISKKYLDQLFVLLKMAGLVRSVRGAEGGYILARKPKEIKLTEIIQTLEGSISPLDCIDNSGTCQRTSSCVTRNLWKKVKKAVTQVLDSTTLEDLIREEKKSKYK